MEFKVIRKQNNSRDCVVCGLANSLSLKTEFYDLENYMVVGCFNAKDCHQSYPNRLHGGMITALLDEVIGRAVQWGTDETWGVTGDISVRFKKPVPLNEDLICVGKIVKNASRLFVGEGFIEDKRGNLLATASATYIKLPVNKITEQNMDHDIWFLHKSDNDLKSIEIKNYNYFEKST